MNRRWESGGCPQAFCLDGLRPATVLAISILSCVAACGDRAGPVDVGLDPEPVIVVTVEPDSLALSGVGSSRTLRADVREETGAPRPDLAVSWSSSDTFVVGVAQDGLVTATGLGTAVVTASAGGASGTATVWVHATVTRVVVDPPSPVLLPGASTTLTAVALDADGAAVAGLAVTWRSDDESVATVAPDGLLTGREQGVTAVVASISGVSGTASVSVGDAGDWTRVHDWANYHYDVEHSGFVPVTLDPARFEAAWSTVLKQDLYLSPVTTGPGSVFVSVNGYWDDHFLFSVDVATGEPRWIRHLSTVNGLNGPSFADGQVLVSSVEDENSFYMGFDAATGATLFQSPYDNSTPDITDGGLPFLPPLVHDGAVYFGANGGLGAARLDVMTGSVQWARTEGVGRTGDGWTGSYRDGRLYIAGRGLRVLDAATGETVMDLGAPRYRFGHNPPQGAILGPDGDVYSAVTGRLIRWNTSDGSTDWQLDVNVFGQLTIVGDELYMRGGGYRWIEARRRSDGVVLWTWEPVDDAHRFTGSIVATENLLFVSSKDTTWALHRGSGLPVWSYPAGGELAISKEGYLIIASPRTTLTGIRIQ